MDKPKKAFASGRVINGQVVITLADGTQVPPPRKVSVTVEVEYDQPVDIIEAAKEVAVTQEIVTIEMSTIPRSEIKAYMDSVRALPDLTPWYKRIFRRKRK
jgi:hypothetical protein